MDSESKKRRRLIGNVLNQQHKVVTPVYIHAPTKEQEKINLPYSFPTQMPMWGFRSH